MTRAAILAICLCLAAATARAADSQGQYAVKGLGLASCQRFIEEREKQSNAYFVFGGWVLGYLTGINRFSEETFEVAPWEGDDTLLAFLAGHCGRNPETKFAVAVNEMVRALMPARLTDASPMHLLGTGDQRTAIYKDSLRRVQRKLAQSGHYLGAADGEFGPETQAALEKYQQERNLPITGVPDQRTLYDIFRVQR